MAEFFSKISWPTVIVTVVVIFVALMVLGRR